jgi:hypothetical protein
MCTAAYRQALMRDLPAAASSALDLTQEPSQRQAAEAGREDISVLPLRRRREPGQEEADDSRELIRECARGFVPPNH